MGLYDRDYAHRRQPGFRGGFEGGFGSGAGMRPGGWSANAWIIAICVAVFMIDGLVGPRFEISAGRAVNDSLPEQVLGRAEPIERSGPAGSLPGARARPIVDPQTGTVVGEQRFFVMPPFQAIGHFSTGKGFAELEVWRLIGFQFLHANLTHLFLNMLGLYFFGPLVESRLGRKKYVAFYLICGIAGAIMYLILNALGYMGVNVPGVLFNDVYTPLIGASAGVFGILMASAYLAPNSTVLLFFIIPAPLKFVVYGFVALAAFNLLRSGTNAGGDAAHLGGAIAGAFFVRRPHLLNNFLDFTGSGSPPPKRPKRPRPDRPGKSRGGPSDEEIDRILSKVATEGLQSLTDRERKTLQKASESKR